jgi:hypothetical protein
MAPTSATAPVTPLAESGPEGSANIEAAAPGVTVVKPAKKLPGWAAWLLLLFIPLSFSLFIAGLVGLFIMTDTDEKTWLGQTYYASQYRRLIAWNPICNSIFFNAGILGTMFGIHRLREHRSLYRCTTLCPSTTSGGHPR